MKQSVNARITTFTRLGQSELLGYGQNVYTLMSNNSDYESFSEDYTRLNESLNAYATALSNINTGNYNATTVKDEAKTVVLDNLRTLARGVSAAANGVESYITGAGFHLWNPRTSNLGPPTTPSIGYAKSNGNPGQLKIEISKATRTTGATYFFEYSLDDGLTWTNGTHSKRASFTATGLPASLNMLLRVKAMANNGQVSGFSMPILCAVV